MTVWENLTYIELSDTVGFFVKIQESFGGGTIDDGDIRAVLTAMQDWAGGLGTDVFMAERINGFLNLALIGAGIKRDVSAIETRSRGDTCPADVDDILKYAVGNVPDLDPNKNLRAAGICKSP